MSMSKVLSDGTDILLILFAVYLFYCYFDIFFTRKKRKTYLIAGFIIFTLWQLIILKVNTVPVYVNISITTVVTLISVMVVYEGGFWNKCIFTFVFNAIWMMIETLIGYVLLPYCNQLTYPQAFEIEGSLISKLLFFCLIILLKKVLTNDEIKELSVKYSIMLVLIPTGSIYVMNEIFLFSYQLSSNRVNFYSAMAAIILLGMNVLIFYIYMKLADDLRLRRMNTIYEQQLELCERHQEERELSVLQLRDVKHNMKNNFISILAYAENGECEKIIRFVNEIMEEGGISIATITNSGNIVIDSLIGYWYVTAQKRKIDFSVNINIPMNMSFKGADICLILGNLLENAVEAAEKVEGKKYIQVHMKYDKGNLIISVKNNYKGQLIKMKDDRLKSTKENARNHGVGLSSVYRAATKYHGMITIDDSVPEQFLIRIVLYGKEKLHE